MQHSFRNVRQTTTAKGMHHSPQNPSLLLFGLGRRHSKHSIRNCGGIFSSDAVTTDAWQGGLVNQQWFCCSGQC